MKHIKFLKSLDPIVQCSVHHNQKLNYHPLEMGTVQQRTFVILSSILSDVRLYKLCEQK
jgi:hypothetical protein